MKAYVINNYGDTNVFERVEKEEPSAKEGYVVVRVEATSINPLDCRIRKGEYPAITPAFPAVLHGDVAGVIEEVGEGVTQFKVGDEVFGCAGGIKGNDGALAEYMSADAKLLAIKPKNLSMTETAALPLIAITAWEAMFEKVAIKKGQKVLIHGGTGGVGHIAVQLAAWADAEVYTTVSSDENAKIARSFGAKETINFREEKVEDYVNRLTDGKGFDFIFDTVGGKNLENSMAALAMYGHIATTQAGTLDLNPLKMKSGSLHTALMLLPLIHNVQRERHGDIMKKITELAEAGKINPLISKVFNFDQVKEAHSFLESGKATGKVVISK